MSDRVAQGPDINIYPEDTTKSWLTQIRRNGIPRDITDFDFTSVVLDGEVEVATVPITITDGPNGELRADLDADTIALLKRYSTWRLTDHTDLQRPFVQRRIVRQR